VERGALVGQIFVPSGFEAALSELAVRNNYFYAQLLLSNRLYPTLIVI
jgi:hypothetical protein